MTKKSKKNKTVKRQNQREASFDIVLHCQKKMVLGEKKKVKSNRRNFFHDFEAQFRKIQKTFQTEKPKLAFTNFHDERGKKVMKKKKETKETKP